MKHHPKHEKTYQDLFGVEPVYSVLRRLAVCAVTETTGLAGRELAQNLEIVARELERRSEIGVDPDRKSELPYPSYAEQYAKYKLTEDTEGPKSFLMSALREDSGGVRDVTLRLTLDPHRPLDQWELVSEGYLRDVPAAQTLTGDHGITRHSKVLSPAD